MVAKAPPYYDDWRAWREANRWMEAPWWRIPLAVVGIPILLATVGLFLRWLLLLLLNAKPD